MEIINIESCKTEPILQTELFVGGCKIKLNCPMNPSDSVVENIKKILISDSANTEKT